MNLAYSVPLMVFATRIWKAAEFGMLQIGPVLLWFDLLSSSGGGGDAAKSLGACLGKSSRGTAELSACGDTYMHGIYWGRDCSLVLL